MNRTFASLTVALSMVLPLALPASAQDPFAKKPTFLIGSEPLLAEKRTEIPGHTLEPGNYSIRILDRLRDRVILRVNDADDNPVATFIGLHNPDFDPFVALKQQGPIFWTASPKGTTAMRAFAFPDGNTLEFVYPKAEAVALAKLNTNSVPAIDPESEGRKPDPKLSPEDREVVTLWLLSSTRVGPKGKTPAIEAKRFMASNQPAELNPAAQQAAAAKPPAAPKADPARPAPAQLAQLDRAEAPHVHSPVKRLPQTASGLPLLLLLSLVLLSAAAVLRLARTAAA